MSSGKILLGLLAGIAAGATLGILFAPEKGSTTRRKITQKGDDYVDELGQRFNSFVDGVSKQYDAVVDKATRTIENGKVKLEKYESDGMSTLKS